MTVNELIKKLEALNMGDSKVYIHDGDRYDHYTDDIFIDSDMHEDKNSGDVLDEWFIKESLAAGNQHDTEPVVTLTFR